MSQMIELREGFEYNPEYEPYLTATAPFTINLPRRAGSSTLLQHLCTVETERGNPTVLITSMPLHKWTKTDLHQDVNDENYKPLIGIEKYTVFIDNYGWDDFPWDANYFGEKVVKASCYYPKQPKTEK